MDDGKDVIKRQLSKGELKGDPQYKKVPLNKGEDGRWQSVVRGIDQYTVQSHRPPIKIVRHLPY